MTRTLFCTTGGESTVSHCDLDRFLSKYFLFPVSTILQTIYTRSLVYHRRSVNLSNEDDFKKHAKNLIQHHNMKNQAEVPAHPFLSLKLDID